MQRLSQDYRALDATEHKKMQELGEHARQLHAEGLPNFPMHSRRAMAKKGVATSSHTNSLMMDLSLEDRSQFMKMVFEGKSTQVPPLPQQGQTFQNQFQVLTRVFARDVADENSKAETEAQDKLQALLSSTAHEAILQDRRRLKEVRAARFGAMPHTCPALSCTFVLEQVVPQSWTSTHANRQHDAPLSANLLAEAWGSRHKGLRDDHAAFRDPGLQQKPCWANHFCQCVGRGKQIKTLFQRFRAFLTKLGEDEAVQNKLLEGKVVFVWVSSVKDGGAMHRDQNPSGETLDKDEVFYAFTHLSLLYQRPWRPTLTVVQAADSETNQRISRVFGRNLAITPANLSMWFRLKVEPSLDGMVDVTSLWEHLDQFDLNLGIDVSLLELSERQAPTQDLTVFSARLMPIECKELWRGHQLESRVPRGVGADAREILEVQHIKHQQPPMRRGFALFAERKAFLSLVFELLKNDESEMSLKARATFLKLFQWQE